MTPTSVYVDCSVYKLTGKSKNRAVLLNGHLSLHSLPPGVALATAPYLPKGTKVTLRVGDVLPRNSVYIREVFPLTGKYTLGVLPDPGNATAVEEILEGAAVYREEKKMTKAKWKKRSTVAALKVGSVRKAVVTRVEPYGVFVDCGAKRDGLLHVTNVTAVVGEFVDGRRGGVSFEEVGCGVGARVVVEVNKVSKNGRAFEVGLVGRERETWDKAV